MCRGHHSSQVHLGLGIDVLKFSSNSYILLISLRGVNRENQLNTSIPSDFMAGLNILEGTLNFSG